MINWIIQLQNKITSRRNIYSRIKYTLPKIVRKTRGHVVIIQSFEITTFVSLVFFPLFLFECAEFQFPFIQFYKSSF